MSSPHDIERVRGPPGDSVGNSAAVYWPCPSLDEVRMVMVTMLIAVDGDGEGDDDDGAAVYWTCPSLDEVRTVMVMVMMVVTMILAVPFFRWKYCFQ